MYKLSRAGDKASGPGKKLVETWLGVKPRGLGKKFLGAEK